MKCHQRKVRERVAEKDPRPVTESLKYFYVKETTRDIAENIIFTYEWLGTMNTIPRAFVGLFSPTNECHGVVCFGNGGGTLASSICDHELAKPIALERGACVHYAHPHAASCLIANACRLMYEVYGYNVFFAYSDAEAGEIGTVYQACNWLYLGQSPGRAGSHRTAYKHPETGEILSSRVMRRKRAALGISNLSELDATWERIKVKDKHKYVWIEGSKTMKKRLRHAIKYPVLKYPKRPTEEI